LNAIRAVGRDALARRAVALIPALGLVYPRAGIVTELRDEAAGLALFVARMAFARARASGAYVFAAIDDRRGDEVNAALP
jgi:hypothetical protein